MYSHSLMILFLVEAHCTLFHARLLALMFHFPERDLRYQHFLQDELFLLEDPHFGV